MNKINLYGYIGEDITASGVAEMLEKAAGQDLEITLFSGGGNVYEGLAIYAALKSYTGRKKIKVVGLSASMATYVQLAADIIEASPDAYFMIHNPRGGFYGDSKQAENLANQMAKIRETMLDAYVAKCNGKRTREQIAAAMDDETWLTAAEALEFGLIDSIVESSPESNPQPIAASINKEILAKAPKAVQDLFSTKKQNNTTMKDKLIKALSLSAEASETDIIARVSELNSDIEAKAELVKSLNAKVEAKQSELESIQGQIKAFEATKLVASVLKDLDIQVSEAIEAKCTKRAERILAEKDEDFKAQLQEDLKLFAKANGVSASAPAQEPSERKATTSFNSAADKVMAVNAKVEELMKADEKLTAAQAYDMACEALGVEA